MGWGFSANGYSDWIGLPGFITEYKYVLKVGRFLEIAVQEMELTTKCLGKFPLLSGEVIPPVIPAILVGRVESVR